MARKTVAASVAEKTDEVQITELESISPTRVDGVGTPANGFPILMMKAVATPAAAPVAAAQEAAKAKCACGTACTCVADAKASKKAAKAAKKAAEATRVDAATKNVHTGDDGQGSNSSSTAENITPDVIKTAVAEALIPSQERIATLEAELAKVKATPIPGGPLLVTPQTARPTDNPAIQKAARLRAIAAQTSDPEVKRDYLALAAREEGAPIT